MARQAKKTTKKRALPDDIPEYAVDRDTLMQFFRPPFGKSKFYELQNDGFIVPVEGVRGWYRLNLSLVRMGLRPVKELPPQPDKRQEEECLVRFALTIQRMGEEAALVVARTLRAEDVADCALFCTDLPRHGIVGEMLVRPR